MAADPCAQIPHVQDAADAQDDQYAALRPSGLTLLAREVDETGVHDSELDWG